MIKFVLVFLLIVAGVIVGPLFMGHQGYVLIQTQDWNIETSVTAFAITLFLGLAIILLLDRFIRRVFDTMTKAVGWFGKRKRYRANQQTREGLIKLAEGDYAKVEKLLSRSADYAEQPVLNYLLAAEAARQCGDEVRASQYLERADDLAEKDKLPVEIARLRTHLARNQNEDARKSMFHLLGTAPRHPEVLRLAGKTYARTGDWEALLEILPAMQKAHVIDEDQNRSLWQKAWSGLMHQCMTKKGSRGLLQWWNDQSKQVRRDSQLQLEMVDHLIECDDHLAAQQILLEGLKRHFDERLIQRIPRLRTDTEGLRKLEDVVSRYIKQQGDTPLLKSVFGQILMKKSEWLGAKDAFEDALKHRPDVLDNALLADVLDRLHCPEEAARVRQTGLGLALKTLNKKTVENEQEVANADLVHR